MVIVCSSVPTQEDVSLRDFLRRSLSTTLLSQYRYGFNEGEQVSAGQRLFQNVTHLFGRGCDTVNRDFFCPFCKCY